MTARINKLAAVDLEIEEIADYIAADKLEAGLRFADQVKKALIELSENPQRGAPLELENLKLKNVRFWNISGFEKYLVIYQPIRDGISVLHVVCGTRDLLAILNQ